MKDRPSQVWLHVYAENNKVTALYCTLLPDTAVLTRYNNGRSRKGGRIRGQQHSAGNREREGERESERPENEMQVCGGECNVDERGRDNTDGGRSVDAPTRQEQVCVYGWKGSVVRD